MSCSRSSGRREKCPTEPNPALLHTPVTVFSPACSRSTSASPGTGIDQVARLDGGRHAVC